MSRDLIQQLQQLKHREVKPRAEWVTRNRALLLMQIKNSVGSRAGSKMSDKRFAFELQAEKFFARFTALQFMRPVAALLVVAMVVTSGWAATASASRNTLPGDWLYPAKRATESAQLAAVTVVGSKTSETKLHVEFAKRRADEVKQVINHPAKKEKAAEAVQDLKKELESVNKNLEELRAKPAEVDGAQTAKDVKKDAEDIKNVLKEVKTGLDNAVGTNNAVLSAQVTNVKEAAADTEIKAVEVMVVKHVEGDASVSQQEVKDAINNTLQNSAQDAAQSKQQLQEKNTVAAEVAHATQTSAPEIKTTPTVATIAAAALAETKETKQKAEVVAKEVAQTVGGTLQILSKDQVSKEELLTAVEKVKEVGQKAKEAEQLDDKAAVALSNVLPIVIGTSTTGTVGIANIVLPTTTSNTTSIPSDKDKITAPVETKLNLQSVSAVKGEIKKK